MKQSGVRKSTSRARTTAGIVRSTSVPRSEPTAVVTVLILTKVTLRRYPDSVRCAPWTELVPFVIYEWNKRLCHYGIVVIGILME